MPWTAVTFTATSTADATMQVINRLTSDNSLSPRWTDLGIQTLTGSQRVNYGGTLYEITARGISNSLGITFFTIISAGYMASYTSHPCYPSHLNTLGNFIPYSSTTPHANNSINLRVCGAFAPNVYAITNDIGSYNSYRLFYDETSFVLIHNANYFPSSDAGGYNWMYRNFPRALVFLSWQTEQYKFATIFNDFYTPLQPFHHNRVNMITLVQDLQTSQVMYYYNDSRTANVGQTRSQVLTTFVTTGISFGVYPSGAETRIGASNLKLRAGNMDVDLPNNVIFFVTDATLSLGVVLDFTPIGQYQCYRLLNTNPKFYIGVRAVPGS